MTTNADDVIFFQLVLDLDAYQQQQT